MTITARDERAPGKRISREPDFKLNEREEERWTEGAVRSSSRRRDADALLGLRRPRRNH